MRHVRVPLVIDLAWAVTPAPRPAVIFAHIRLAKGGRADIGVWTGTIVRVRRGGRGMAGCRHWDRHQGRLGLLATVVKPHAEREEEDRRTTNGNAGNGAAIQYCARVFRSR